MGGAPTYAQLRADCIVAHVGTFSGTGAPIQHVPVLHSHCVERGLSYWPGHGTGAPIQHVPVRIGT